MLRASPPEGTSIRDLGGTHLIAADNQKVDCINVARIPFSILIFNVTATLSLYCSISYRYFIVLFYQLTSQKCQSAHSL